MACVTVASERSEPSTGASMWRNILDDSSEF